jgi:DNA polymerase-3 subunit delta
MGTMIIYLFGPDSSRLQETLSQMKEKFTRERDPQGLNLVELRIDESDVSDIVEQLYATPFLAEKRMIVLRDLIGLGTKELHSTLHEHLIRGNDVKDRIVIVTDGAVSPRATASKELQAFLESQPYSQSFGQLEGRALQDWIIKEVSNRLGTIDVPAATLLSAHTWNNSIELSHVLDQLIAYVSGKSITARDAAIFIPQQPEDDIFALIDLVVKGNAKEAIERIRDQYRLGKDASYIFSMLLRQYRIMLDIADVFDRNMTPDAKAMGIHPFVLKKTIPLVQRMTMKDIQSRYAMLVDMDRQMKTSEGSMEDTIDLFVMSAAYAGVV